MVDWLAIVNPQAGALRNSNFGARWVPEIERAVARVAYTTEPRHASVLAKNAGDYEGIVAVGGDGTVYEVLAGIDRAHQRLAVIPAGRGNSFARELGVDIVPVAIAALSSGQVQAIDLMGYELVDSDGAIQKGLAASTLALGYVVSMVLLAARFDLFGRSAYAVAAPFVRPERSRVEIAYGTEAPQTQAATGIIVNNTSWLSSFRAFPQASLSDGLLSVMELNAGWLQQNLHELSVLTRLHFYNPAQVTTTETVRIRLPGPTTLLVDGELLDNVLETRVWCIPKALSFQGPGSQ